MAEHPPVHNCFPESKQLRYKEIIDKFVCKYGNEPTFFARAPGRVNLIGEHIDYCGYSVLPMAIEQDIIIAVRPNNSQEINISNTDSKTYCDISFSVNNFEISKENPKWYNYFMCGLRGILEHYPSITTPKGFDCMVEGTVPPSSGLSSSSAFVCCAALATMHVNGQSLSKQEISDLCANCERFIGTMGGGMDQAISFMAKEGTAKHIEFNPLRATDVCLPDGAVFVISNSCVEMNKAATAHFNIRVVECRLAAKIMAKQKGLLWQDIKRLGDVQKELGLTLEGALTLVRETFHKEPYSKEEVCKILDVTAEELNQTTLSANTMHVTSFKLYDRATHVFSEANRVIQFKNICDTTPPNALVKLGQLMTDSHVSCRDMYECSCTDLDTLVTICMESGALGSRLTGAGWGGCAVSMVPADQVDAFLQKVKDKYFAQDPARAAKVKTSLFASQPGGGAAIYLKS